MIYTTRKQTLKTVLAVVTIIYNINNFVEAKALPENNDSSPFMNENIKRNEITSSKKGNKSKIYIPIIIIAAAVLFFIIFGILICLKVRRKNKKVVDDVDKSKVTTVDLTLPYPSTVPQKSNTVNERGVQPDESQGDISIVNQSMVRIKPVINGRSVSIRRSIIIDKDYSNYCGFSSFPSPRFQFIAVYDYEAQREDEISLSKNDPLLICTNFEDGWTMGKNCKTDQIGFFPITCLGIGPIEDDESNEPTDAELNMFNKMIVPNGRRLEE